MSAIGFVVLFLATYRASQIVAQEVLFAPVRGWLVQGKTPEELRGARRWLGLLIHCAGCVSVWAGWLLATMWLLPLPGWLALAAQLCVYGLAASGAAVLAGDVLYGGRRP